jgi:hypothetical protein
VEVEPPLFLRASEIMHSRCDILHFRMFIRIIEIHDFYPLEDLSNNEGRPPSDDASSDDGYPSYDPDRGILQLWPWLTRFVADHSLTGEPWSSLPTTGGRVWSASDMIHHPMAMRAARCHHPMVDLGGQPMCHPRAPLLFVETATEDATRQDVGEQGSKALTSGGASSWHVHGQQIPARQRLLPHGSDVEELQELP